MLFCLPSGLIEESYIPTPWLNHNMNHYILFDSPIFLCCGAWLCAVFVGLGICVAKNRQEDLVCQVLCISPVSALFCVKQQWIVLCIVPVHCFVNSTSALACV